MTDDKYRMIPASTPPGVPQLYYVEALKDFGDVREGDIGGQIESEHNLSQQGDCWVYKGALIAGGWRIQGDTQVYDNLPELGGHHEEM